VIVKYNATGALVWAKRIECSFTSRTGGSINKLAVDPTGHIIVCGSLVEGMADFGGTIVFPGSTGTAYGGDWFLARYEPNGDLNWVQLEYAKTLVTDKQGNIFVNWGRPVEGTDGIAKLDTNGVVIWSKAFPNLFTVYTARSGGLALDPNDEPVFTGEFSGTATFGAISLTARSTTDPDFFVAKADATGNIQWALSGGGTGYDRGNRVAVDWRGQIFLTGEVWDQSGTFEGFPLPSFSGHTWFAAKISPTPPLKLTTSIGTLGLSWPVRATNYVLEAATSLPAISWATVTNTPTVTATNRRVQLPLTGPAKFFRLRKP
jgi:hypothetical protein